MNGEDLYYEHEELMSPEELEDAHYEPNSGKAIDSPLFFRKWYTSTQLTYQADAEGRKEFEKRPPALGLNGRMLDEIEGYPNILHVTTSQIRRFFELIKGTMLKNLISCNGSQTLSDLVSILREELSTGVPSPVPSWYKYSTVTMGPRRIGYYSCDCRGCLNTETVDKIFAKCGSCSIPKYCSKECQLIDWKQRHKVVCKAAKKRYDETKKCGQLLQRLSDLSLTGQLSGQLSGIGSMREAIHGAMDNDAVKERRKHLKSEQKR